MRIDRRLFSNIDLVVVISVLALSLTGIMTIYSATRPLPGEEQAPYFVKQIYWLLVGLAAMAAAVAVDYTRLNTFAYVIFGASAVMLLAVTLTGRAGMGAQRWLTIGPVSFQPSEVFKLALILALSRYLSQKTGRLSTRDIAVAFSVFLLVPLLLVLKQPDLGTAIVLLFIFTVVVLTKGIDRRVAALVVVISLVSVPYIGGIVWDELKDYQKKRIVAFVKPDIDPEGISYHITQSKVAIGSGGMIGKGYMKGTQGPLRFLPEKHTDFIFAIFAEEWGFLGSSVLLVAYLMLIMRGLDTAYKAKDAFGRMLSLGLTYMFSFYCFVNIGMTLGLMPVVGIPLPFMSYGGTALVSNCIAAGLLINVRARRFELFY